MHRTIIRGVFIFSALGLILLILLRSRLPFGKGNSSFSSDPKKEITKIELSRHDRKLYLVKEDGNWLLNGNIEARKSGILFMIRILQEIKIKSPVSPELFRSEISEKGIEPVRVRVYDNRKLIKSFLVYKTGSNIYGNIMKIKERSKPFIVYVPGFEGDIGSGFTLNELFWQPFTVFNYLPSEISSVKLENFSDTASSFTILRSNNHYSLSYSGMELKGWDSSRVTRYLSYFAWVPFEKWDFELGEKEIKLVESRRPLYRITVITPLGKKSVLTLWEKMKEAGGTTTKDSDRLLGKTQNSDELFVMRYFDIDPLLKKRSYFFPD